METSRQFLVVMGLDESDFNNAWHVVASFCVLSLDFGKLEKGSGWWGLGENPSVLLMSEGEGVGEGAGNIQVKRIGKFAFAYQTCGGVLDFFQRPSM